MSLPARVLAPATRSIGMGMFYTMYYASMMLGPVAGGAVAKWAGNAGAAFDFGAPDAGLPGAAVGFQSDRAGCGKHGLTVVDAYPRNHSLTLPAVGSGDTEKPVVGWRRWR